jgi:hypothetical protein
MLSHSGERLGMKIGVIHWDSNGGEWVEEHEATPEEERMATIREEQRRQLWRWLLAPEQSGGVES